jgi:hypothetical protein
MNMQTTIKGLVAVVFHIWFDLKLHKKKYGHGSGSAQKELTKWAEF